jgi:hypothetical protein
MLLSWNGTQLVLAARELLMLGPGISALAVRAAIAPGLKLPLTRVRALRGAPLGLCAWEDTLAVDNSASRP